MHWIMEKELSRSGGKLLPYSSRALGVFRGKQETYIFYASSTKENRFQVDRARDGPNFNLLSEDARIIFDGKRAEKIKNCHDFRVAEIGNKYFLAYKLINKNRSSLSSAESTDLINWRKIGKISTPAETGMLVPNFKYKSQYVLYFGEKSGVVALSPDLKSWKIFNRPISHIAGDKGDKIKIMDITVNEEGIFLVYCQYRRKGKISSNYRLKAALFDKENPSKLLWDIAIWEQKGGKKESKTSLIGVIIQKNKLVSYWQFEGEKIFALVIPLLKSAVREKDFTFIAPVIKKSGKNPIIKPIAHHFWESQAVFNPAAFFDEGEIHIVYRAVGDNNISTLGYAKSKDGLNIDERHNNPIYVPTHSSKDGRKGCCPNRSTKDLAKQYASSSYVSGPGYGGCEDPRISKIGDKLYMTYVAFDGFNPPRVALTSIAASDFHNKDWNWSKPALLSPPDEVHKNWVIFPEKINGKYAVLHSIAPSVLIDYLDTLDLDEGTYIRSRYRPGLRKNRWDNWLRGVGPPPLRTQDGWLLFYHAMDDNDPGKYKMGAMLLDIDKPEIVKYCASTPVLEPDERYENEGFKAGVVYACGSLIKDDTLYLYYGASDTSVAVATANLKIFLTQLKESHYAALEKTGTKSRHPVVH